jgi:hypothetical protein
LLRSDTNGNVARKATYWRVAGAAESAIYTWKFGSAQAAVGTALSYTGVSTSAPIAAHGGQFSSRGRSIDAPSLRTAASNSMVVAFFGAANRVSMTPPVGMKESAEQSSPARVRYLVTGQANHVVQAKPGATGVKTATMSSTAAGVGQLVALRPAD